MAVDGQYRLLVGAVLRYCSALLLLLALGSAPAEAAPRPLNAQQQRMKDCNGKASADALKHAARREFMRRCLSGGKVEVELGGASASEAAPAPDEQIRASVIAPEPEAASKAAWRKKLGVCIGQARTQDLKGAERKAFMSACLKPSPTP